MIFLQEFLGRRDPTRNELLQRPQVACLVVAITVEPLSALQTPLGERERRLRKLANAATPDGRLESELRHLVAQPLAFLRAPVFDQIPGGIEHIVIVEQADPKRRQRRQPSPWS